MNETILETLKGSQDSRELVTGAVQLARSRSVEDHRVLQNFLLSATFLDRLDTAEEYDTRPRDRLRIAQVLGELRRNPEPSARDLLVRLTESLAFTEQADRVDLLIVACASVRPPPPAVLAFWDTHCRPNDGFTPLTIDALTENGSEPAIQLLEKKFADPSHPLDAKLDWMHRSIVPHRDDLELLLGCERMLAGGVPPALRPPLVEALFDYRPDQWYPEHLIRTPPNRVLARPEAKAQLRNLAEYSLASIPMGPELRSQVEAVLEGLEQRP